MMKLTAKNVDQVITDCLFKEGEEPVDPVIAEGVVRKFGFHKERLESHKQDIKELLDCLPEAFKVDGGGGGMSFLNACMTKDGEQWGEHVDIEGLLALGIATKQAKILLPKDMWKILPGGMPYFAVGDFSEEWSLEEPKP